MAVTIIINGESREICDGTTIAQLLTQLEIPPRGAAVELNFEILPRARHCERTLADGDQVEIVSLVGGG